MLFYLTYQKQLHLIVQPCMKESCFAEQLSKNPNLLSLSRISYKWEICHWMLKLTNIWGIKKQFSVNKLNYVVTVLAAQGPAVNQQVLVQHLTNRGVRDGLVTQHWRRHDAEKFD